MLTCVRMYIASLSTSFSLRPKHSLAPRTPAEREFLFSYPDRQPKDAMDSIQELTAQIRRFRDDRDWMQFHDPKNLAGSICIEAAELLELFQWTRGETSNQLAKERKERVSEEIADVAIYLLELADVVDIDVAQAIREKLQKNAVKYPIDKARGVSTKYTDLK